MHALRWFNLCLLDLAFECLTPSSLTSPSAWRGRSGLSEGEWQRLQLARFLMRADVAKLLLLDEPFKGVSPSEASRMLAALGAQARATGQVRQAPGWQAATLAMVALINNW